MGVARLKRREKDGRGARNDYALASESGGGRVYVTQSEVGPSCDWAVTWAACNAQAAAEASDTANR